MDIVRTFIIQGEVERKNGEAAPTKMDLIGFWELVSIQVDQSKSSLKELHDKKENDWKVCNHKILFKISDTTT